MKGIVFVLKNNVLKSLCSIHFIHSLYMFEGCCDSWKKYLLKCVCLSYVLIFLFTQNSFYINIFRQK